MALRRRASRHGLPDAWRSILDQRSAQWRVLDEPERSRLGELADWLLRNKRWEAARDFELTDEVRTLVSAHASLLVLGLDESWFASVGTIVIRAGSMTQRAGTGGAIRGIVHGDPHWVDGESHHDDGPLMVSWRAARREAAQMRLGRDVVLHEFAHKIDMHDGVLDGTHLLESDEATARWVDVCTRHFESVRAGEPGASLRSYAGTNVAEFFAVATETFFTRAIELAEHQRDLYDLFAGFYRQDPAARLQRFLAHDREEALQRIALNPARIIVRRTTPRPPRP